MDQQELENRIQQARREGYSDEEISAALGGAGITTVPSKIPETDSVPVLTAEERARLQQEETVETARREEVNTPANVTSAALAVPVAAASALPYAGAAVGTAAGAYGAYKVGQVANKFLRGAPTAGPVPPSGMPGSPSNPIGTGVRPVAPPSMAPATPQVAQPASMLDKTTAMIRQLAANKVLQNVARVGGVGLTAGLTSGNIGQNYMVPEVGRMRGMEINPLTGRPWTKEQLDMYSQNPAAYDAQLGAPQMPR